MLATQALFLKKRKVILIDADIVGTEASGVLLPDITKQSSSLAVTGVSLIDVFDRVPDSRSVIRWIEDEIEADLERVPGCRRFIMRSFSAHELPDQRVWRDVLEKSGLYVQRRMRDLVSAWRAKGFDVVVDLPAFDVGFVKEARAALELEPECKIFFVTDADVRSIDATTAYLKELEQERIKRKARDPDDKTPEPILVINRVPPNMRANLHDLPNWVVVELERDRDDEGIERHTRHRLYDGRAKDGVLPVLDGILKEEKVVSGVRFLRGET